MVKVTIYDFFIKWILKVVQNSKEKKKEKKKYYVWLPRAPTAVFTAVNHGSF